MGNANARVLPVPVRALPRKSFPLKMWVNEPAWMGNRAVTPRAINALFFLKNWLFL